MADQNITELPIKTNSGVAATDYMLGIDASEGYQILVRDVMKYGMENYNGSTLAGSAQTPKSAIDTLNSNLGRIKQAFVKAGTSGQNGTTDTVTLDAQGLYMVCISRINSSTAVAGMYLVTPYSGNTSNITAIKEAGTNVGAVAISGLDVSITYAANYVNATIIKLV